MAKTTGKKVQDLFGKIPSEAVESTQDRSRDPVQLREMSDEIDRLHQQISDLKTQRDEARAIIKSGGVVHFGRCELTHIGLLMPDDLTRDEWLYIGSQLNEIGRALQWMVGDWAVRGEDNTDLWTDGTQADKEARRQRYQGLVESTGYKHGTIKNWASVARNVPFEERRENLDYSYHVAVSGLPIAKMRTLLDKAEENPIPIREFRDMVIRAKGEKPLALPHLVRDRRAGAFRRIIRALKRSTQPSREDIDAMRAWLDEVEKNL